MFPLIASIVVGVLFLVTWVVISSNEQTGGRERHSLSERIVSLREVVDEARKPKPGVLNQDVLVWFNRDGTLELAEPRTGVDYRLYYDHSSLYNPEHHRQGVQISVLGLLQKLLTLHDVTLTPGSPATEKSLEIAVKPPKDAPTCTPMEEVEFPTMNPTSHIFRDVNGEALPPEVQSFLRSLFL